MKHLCDSFRWRPLRPRQFTASPGVVHPYPYTMPVPALRTLSAHQDDRDVSALPGPR